MNNQPDITADAHRPEVRIPYCIQLVELHTWIRRIELQIKHRQLDRFLLTSSQLGKAICESVGDSEVHHDFVSDISVLKWSDSRILDQRTA